MRNRVWSLTCLVPFLIACPADGSGTAGDATPDVPAEIAGEVMPDVAPAASVASALEADATLNLYVRFQGAKQGLFASEQASEKWKSWQAAVRFSSDLALTSEGRLDCGAASVRLTRRWGAASAQVLQAMATNENLAQVEVDFVGADTLGTGGEILRHKVLLENARIFRVERATTRLDATCDSLAEPVEEVWLRFERMTYTYLTGQAQTVLDCQTAI